MICLKQAQDFIVTQIAKLDLEIEKCKKARGPQAKKMKDKQTLLSTKVDQVRVLKGKISEIHSALSNCICEGSLIRNLKALITDLMNVVSAQGGLED